MLNQLTVSTYRAERRVEPLVRETIQNCLDATPEGQTTRVVFTFGQAPRGRRRLLQSTATASPSHSWFRSRRFTSGG